MLKTEATPRAPLRPVLTDLGLAKLIEGLPLTRDGESLGTPAYMSPEQAQGLPLDARSDVYSLGILLYELAVGCLPFPAKTISEAIRYHNNEPPPDPQTFRPDIPTRLIDVILKSLAKKPDERYPNASGLAQAIETALGSMPQPTPASQQTGKTVSLLSQYQEKLTQETEPLSIRVEGDKLSTGGDAIEIRSPNAEARKIALSQQLMTIGRGEDNDIVINDPKASRHHARLEFDGRNYLAIDLNSTNGTQLGDARLLPGVREIWTPEKLLRIGATVMSLTRKEAINSPGPGEGKGSQQLSFTSAGGRVGISLDTSILSVDPGNSTAIRLSLVNQSSVVDHFQASVEGIPIEWLTQISPEVQLLPLEKAGMEVVIQPPRSTQSRAGQYPMIIRVAGRAVPGDAVETRATLTVTPFYAIQSTMQPQKQRGPEVGNFSLSTENKSNTDLQVTYTASNPEDSCTFTFTPPTIILSPGATQQVKIAVRSKYPLQDWSSHSFPFCVTASIANLPTLTQQLPGEFEQVAPTFEISLKPSKVRGILEGNFLVALTNLSHNPINVALEAIDPASACQYLFEISKLDLAPGGERLVRLTVQTKGKAIVEQSRNIPFTVIARLPGGSNLSREVEGEWEQIPPSIEINLLPPKKSSEVEAEYTIQVANHSDVQLSVDLQVLCSDGGCSAVMNPSQVLLLPGELRSAKLEVRPDHRLGGKEPHLYPFEVSALIAGTSHPTVSIRGEFEQLPTSQPPSTIPEPVIIPKPRHSFVAGCLTFIVGVIMTYMVAVFILEPTHSGQSLAAFLVIIIPGLALTSTISYRAWKKKKIVALVIFALVCAALSFIFFLANSSYW